MQKLRIFSPNTMITMMISSSSITQQSLQSSLIKSNPFHSSSSSSSSTQLNSRNFLFYKEKNDHNKHPLFLKSNQRCFSVKASVSDSSQNGTANSSPFRGSESFFRNVLEGMEAVYLNRNPTAKAILELVGSAGSDKICYDHFAFRTFGVDGHGIDSMAEIFQDFGYTKRDELRFPAKKLKAYWFSPPAVSSEKGSGVYGPLPRVFISELIVDQMSSEAQDIIRKYTEMSGQGNKYGALASTLGLLTWEKPLHSEFLRLARESEYAAWTLVNGYALNHVTISTHQLKSNLRTIDNLNQFIEDSGFKLNSEGGVLKVSPDGFLLQSSTVADSRPFKFSDGVTKLVPCSYIEFAERLVLPQYKNLPEDQIKECHRRDGFEVGNADKIFESTSQGQLSRKAT
ncbi:2-oxoadipate dioxygenase/decarboxylase, chloroplastic [Silene latifolia]|uniref:2-oxoadipate dioxygenase/decarboxylase, chloroplastic n=1 Tax=Silene latifolia TaxID=37657 RepID=UPI003D7756F3